MRTWHGLTTCRHGGPSQKPPRTDVDGLAEENAKLKEQLTAYAGHENPENALDQVQQLQVTLTRLSLRSLGTKQIALCIVIPDIVSRMLSLAQDELKKAEQALDEIEGKMKAVERKASARVEETEQVKEFV